MILKPFAKSIPKNMLPLHLTTYYKVQLCQSWCFSVMVSWCHGVMVSWCHGVMGHGSWCHGVMVSWCHGVMVSWCHGVIVTPLSDSTMNYVTMKLASPGREFLM